MRAEWAKSHRKTEVNIGENEKITQTYGQAKRQDSV